MLLIRTTLLVGLGVLVLPTDEASQTRFYGSARTAMGWTVTFCDRNPDTCTQGRQAWAVFLKKAEFGAKVAFDLISERNKHVAETATQTTKPVDAHPAAADPVSVLRRGTLKPGDLEPAWRGKVARAGG